MYKYRFLEADRKHRQKLFCDGFCDGHYCRISDKESIQVKLEVILRLAAGVAE